MADDGRRKALTIGALMGGLLGAIFSGGYVAASFWICVSASSCSVHWLPFVLVPAVGLPLGILAGTLIAIVLRKFYGLVRV